MAKRESQGMLVAVILLVIFSVLLCVSTYYFWSQSSSLAQDLASQTTKKNTAELGLIKASKVNQELKELIGHAPDEDMEVVRSTHAENMKLFDKGFAEEQRSYLKMPDYLLGTIRQMNTKIGEAGATEFQLKEQLTQAQKDVQAAKERADTRVQEITDELNTEKTAFAQERARMKTTVTKLQTNFTAARRKLEVANANLKNEKDGLITKVDKLEFQIRNLVRQIEQYEDQTFDIPDGEITWVDQTSRTVTLNLGVGDGLRRQVTFSVYDVDTNNLAKAEKKGTIEVTRLLGPHKAEARIVHDENSDPVITGDVIYTPLWQVGANMRFALAGFMDINGDGRSDRQIIKNIITLNGGTVDAELTEEGQVTGELSIRTRYLVLGERPKIGPLDDPNLIEEYSRFLKEAAQNGVKQIAIEKLIADFGYRGSSRTVGLGAGVSADDFKDRPIGASRFRPRRPPSGR